MCPPAGFLRALSELTRREGALLIADEIYTGLGRTGPLWLHREEGAEADLICLGKALGGGVPISACLGHEEVMRAWGDPGGEAIHTSTFLGNPPACAAALSVLAELERSPVGERAVERGERLKRAIEQTAKVSVRGRGLLLGVEIEGPARVLWLTRALLEKGFITSPGGSPPSVLCLTPPLCLTDAQSGCLRPGARGVPGRSERFRERARRGRPVTPEQAQERPVLHTRALALIAQLGDGSRDDDRARSAAARPLRLSTALRRALRALQRAATQGHACPRKSPACPRCPPMPSVLRASRVAPRTIKCACFAARAPPTASAASTP